MTTRTVEQVDEWESRPFSGGYRGLHDLADERFSGIVTVGPARLCMTKGNVVGILDGDIDDFEGASGTLHEAPSPALPLLAVMQERSDEVRAQYYTEETPIEEVDTTLTEGNFTGFIELSENVLSGDYYLVYHQGRSMSVAFVGESRQLLTEDEAFERANGEVGIYKVKPVDIAVIEIPEASGTPAGGAAAAAETGTSPDPVVEEEPAADREPEPAGDPEPVTDSEPAADREPGDSTTADAEPSGTTEEPASGATGGATDPDPGTAGNERSAETRSEPRQDRATGGQSTDRRREQSTDASTGDRQQRRDTQSRASSQQSRGGRQRGNEARSQAGGRAQGGTEPRGRVYDSAAGHSDDVGRLETRSIPSLDPEQTKEPPNGAADPDPDPSPEPRGGTQPQAGPQETPPRESGVQGGGRGAGENRQPEGGRQQPDSGRQPPAEGRRESQPREPEPTGGTGAEPAGDIGRLEDELAEKESEIDRLEEELATAREERDDLEAERDELREERDELQERVENLERRIDELRTEEGGESVADRKRLSPGEAIDGTNLFVRYDSKGDATLEKAHAGQAEQGAVNDNLSIQHHTQFEAENVAVGGEPFDSFLETTLQYKFVSWVVKNLPYEIRDTGHVDALQDLYDSLPKIDRAELNGAISVTYEEDGEEHRSQETFDIVLRDRMGNPLALANLNESRQPASQNRMESLITAASRVGEAKETLAGAFLVTSSFFEPEAMEAASAATGGGLLSRDKRQSFVKLSRKGGFHLCLVEAREEKFNLSVPEI